MAVYAPHEIRQTERSRVRCSSECMRATVLGEGVAKEDSKEVPHPSQCKLVREVICFLIAQLVIFTKQYFSLYILYIIYIVAFICCFQDFESPLMTRGKSLELSIPHLPPYVLLYLLHLSLAFWKFRNHDSY